MSRQPAHPDKLQTVTTCGPESVTGAPNCRARYTWSAAVQVPALAMASGRVRCCVPDNHLSFASAGQCPTDHGRVNGALGGHSPVAVWSTNKNRHPGRRSFFRSFVH